MIGCPLFLIARMDVMADANEIVQLEKKALEYRRHLVNLAHAHQFGVHIGGGLSLAEILVSLYYYAADIDPGDPEWEDRDRIILSKGHGNIGLLTVLAMKGFFPLDAFESFNQVGSYLSMHADSHVPGIEHSAGSLGHGLAVAAGMALAGKLDQKDYQVYCILGDGEIMEGSNWEALMSSAHFKLDNLTAIIDRNQLSQEGTTEETMRLEPLADKLSSFRWLPVEVNGHSIPELLDAFQLDSGDKPKVIIANTIKGRGIDGIANTISSHFGHLDEKQTKLALDQINSEEKILSQE